MDELARTACDVVARVARASAEPGLDPYDALSGAHIPTWVRAHPRMRQALVQIRKRTPVGLESLLGIEPTRFDKAQGAALTAVCRCLHIGCKDGEWQDLARHLAKRLSESNGRPGAAGCWSYEFDVQTRWAFYPAGCPNLIASFFVTRGLLLDGLVRSGEVHNTVLADVGAYLAGQSRRIGDEESPFIAYTPTSDTLVHNANLLGAGLLAVVGAMTGSPAWVDLGLAAARTSIGYQRDDGSWAYGVGSGLEWSDNFHTAYDLDGLLLVWLATGDADVKDALDRGVLHWIGDFFGPRGEPFYYPRRHYPYDIHSAGTAVDVAARLATWGWSTGHIAETVAAWTTDNLIQPSSGLTYFQKHRIWTDRRHFNRWGDSHWALGCSSLALMRAGLRDPVEDACALTSGVVSHES